MMTWVLLALLVACLVLIYLTDSWLTIVSYVACVVLMAVFFFQWALHRSK